VLNSVALLEMSSRSWCSPSAWPRSAWHPDAHRGSAWMVTCAQVTHLSAAGVWPYGANGGMHTPRALWGGRQQAHRAAPALYLEILGKEGEMSSLKWHCNPQWGLLLKQTVCGALRRELRAAQLQELFKI